ncbi:MAG: peptidylprolyl isomerase [Candidatus Bruticola sp.]
MNIYRLSTLAAVLIFASLQFGCAKTQETAAERGASQAQSQQVQPQENKPAEQSASEPAAQQSQEKESPMSAQYRSLTPFGPEAPTITEYTLVRFETTDGDIDMEIYPQAAPNAAKRFIELVKLGYYNDTPIFRVVKNPRPFVAQFGINWRKGMIDWKDKNFNDDPSLFRLDRGTLAFAKAGPNTNSTQIFINYGDNDFLQQQNFSTFGKVVKGMEVADSFKSVGSPDMGLDQGMLWYNGEAYLKSLPAKQQPTMIKKAYIVK